MRVIKVIKFGIEHEFTIQSHTEIAEKIEGCYNGYSLFCIEKENSIKIYEKNNNYFKKYKHKIGKLYFDINTDTVYYCQYGFPTNIKDSIGIYKIVIENLRENDILIVKGRTSSKVEYRKRINSIQNELKNFISSDKYVYIPKEYLRKWK